MQPYDRSKHKYLFPDKHAKPYRALNNSLQITALRPEEPIIPAQAHDLFTNEPRICLCILCCSNFFLNSSVSLQMFATHQKLQAEKSCYYLVIAFEIDFN